MSKNCCSTASATSSLCLRSVMSWSPDVAVLRQRHSCRERRRFVRQCLSYVCCKAFTQTRRKFAGWAASFFSPSEASFSGEGYRGEDRVPPGDQVSDRERAPVPMYLGQKAADTVAGLRCLCGRSSSKPQSMESSAICSSASFACVAREAGYGQLRQ